MAIGEIAIHFTVQKLLECRVLNAVTTLSESWMFRAKENAPLRPSQIGNCFFNGDGAIW